jgi:hypothetical protein
MRKQLSNKISQPTKDEISRTLNLISESTGCHNFEGRIKEDSLDVNA